MIEEAQQKASIIEQHIGTILQILVVSLLGWSLMTTVDLRTDIGILKAKMEGVQITLSQNSTDRYRGEDATRDFKGVWAEISRIELRLDKCEARTR